VYLRHDSTTGTGNFLAMLHCPHSSQQSSCFFPVIISGNWKSLKRWRKRKKKKRGALGGIQEYWVTASQIWIKTNRRGGSNWVTSDNWHLNATQALQEEWHATQGELIFTQQLHLRFLAHFSLCVFNSMENNCVYVFVGRYGFHADMKRI